MPFLTLEDPNARLKGSRDPLGIQPVWAAFGRHIVKNLTTQSTSVRNFTTFLLGRYFADELVETEKVAPEQALDVFLRTEQIAAYARHVGHNVEGAIRGIERVRQKCDEFRSRVPIDTGRKGLILSDQKIYGLLGLYSVPAKRSGLIPESGRGLADPAREFVEREYMSRIGDAHGAIVRALSRNGTLETRDSNKVYAAFKQILPPRLTAAERAFYGRYVRDAAVEDDDQQTIQSRARALMEQNLDLNEPFLREDIVALTRQAERSDPELAERLTRIAQLEALIAPAIYLFDHVLTQRERTPQHVAKYVRKLWGARLPNMTSEFPTLVAEIRSVAGPEVTAQLVEFQRAISARDYKASIDALFSWNKAVMTGRKAAPWASLSDQGKIDVRFRGSEWGMPERSQLPTLWHNGYFLDSLKVITAELAA
jgi:hypothetical protein